MNEQPHSHDLKVSFRENHYRVAYGDQVMKVGVRSLFGGSLKERLAKAAREIVIKHDTESMRAGQERQAMLDAIWLADDIAREASKATHEAIDKSSEKCSACAGNGYTTITEQMPVYMPGSRPYSYARSENCLTCNGTGKIVKTWPSEALEGAS